MAVPGSQGSVTIEPGPERIRHGSRLLPPHKCSWYWLGSALLLVTPVTPGAASSRQPEIPEALLLTHLLHPSCAPLPQLWVKNLDNHDPGGPSPPPVGTHEALPCPLP